MKSLEAFLKGALNREIRYNPKDVPIVIPVTSKVAAFARSYLPEHPHSLVCGVVFKSSMHSKRAGYGHCGLPINGTKALKVKILSCIFHQQIFLI